MASDIAKVTAKGIVSFWQKEASASAPSTEPPPLAPQLAAIQSELDRVATSLHASVADPGHLDAPVDTLTEADLTLRLTLADLQSVRDLAAKELAGVSSQLSQLASTSNRAAIAEAALKDSQQIVSRQHDALEQTSERLRLNDQQLDLMRNALHRRDELLGSQRAAFYKELLRFQAFAEHEATHARPPASEYASVHESPAFFDACVFEALHLTADEPLVQKAAKAWVRRRTSLPSCREISGARTS